MRGRLPTTARGKLRRLEADKQAKLEEIKEAEIDFKSHKLSAADYSRLDRELRGQAAAIIKELDEVAHRQKEDTR